MFNSAKKKQYLMNTMNIVYNKEIQRNIVFYSGMSGKNVSPNNFSALEMISSLFEIPWYFQESWGAELHKDLKVGSVKMSDAQIIFFCYAKHLYNTTPYLG